MPMVVGPLGPLLVMGTGTAAAYWLWASRGARATGTRNPTGASNISFDSRVDDAGPEYDQRPVRPAGTGSLPHPK